MSELLDQLITPEVRMVLYLMVACLVMLYILSIVYVIRDAQRRGAEPWWLWAVISIIPIVGLLAYVILRPELLPGRPRGAGPGHRASRAPAQPLWHLPQVRSSHRPRLRGVPHLQHPGEERVPHLPPPAERGLEGVPVLPHPHPVARHPEASHKRSPSRAPRQPRCPFCGRSPTAAGIPWATLRPRMWLLADAEVAATYRTKLL
jgi:hypothetical protein